MAYLDNFDAVIFDIGNTLVLQNNPGIPISELEIQELPGVRKLLDSLVDNKKLALMSNSKNLTSAEIMKKLEQIDLAKYFELCISSFDFGIEKPSPLPLIAAADQLKIQPARAIYVGDMETDRISAELAGMQFLYTSQNIYRSFHDFLAFPSGAWQRALEIEVHIDEAFGVEVSKNFDGLVKPPKSLGSLEILAAQIGRITHTQPTIDPCAVAVFVSDHGIAKDDSVTPWPQEITSLMADLIVKGEAGISVIAQNSDVYVEVVNVGTIAEPNSSEIRNVKVANGTKDFRFSPAMSEIELLQALEEGARTAERLVAGGSRALCTGEVGIGNTTSSAILIGYLCRATASEVTGYGSNIPQEIFDNKLKIVDAALQTLSAQADPMKALALFGGLEIAALTGFIMRGATLGVPIILDGVITLAAACMAFRLKPEIVQCLIAGHCSTEPASRIAISKLGLDPILDLNLRLGEGTGAVLSIPILRAACLTYERMGKLEKYI